MNPRFMDHLSGPSSWIPSWTRYMDYPCGPPLILLTYKQKILQMKERSDLCIYMDKLTGYHY